MTRAVGSLGQVFTDADQVIVDADDRYLEIVDRDRADLIGRTALSFTYDRDLPRNRPLLDALVASGPSFAITKRYVRGDGSVVWVENHVSRVNASGGRILHASSRVIGRPFGSDRLARNYGLARSLAAALIEGRQRLGGDIVSAPAVEALLWLYRAEVEVRVVSVDDVARRTGTATSVAIRWLTLLRERGLVEADGDDVLFPASVIRISGSGERAMDGLLSRLGSDPAASDQPSHP